jgi:hypothetical protein
MPAPLSAATPPPPKKPDAPAASQDAPPLSPAPAVKSKEAYVWDETKGID